MFNYQYELDYYRPTVRIGRDQYLAIEPILVKYIKLIIPE